MNSTFQDGFRLMVTLEPSVRYILSVGTMNRGMIAPIRVRTKNPMYVGVPTADALELMFCPSATAAPTTAPRLNRLQQMEIYRPFWDSVGSDKMMAP